MERRIRIVGLCLIVALALSAVIAANANASTEMVVGCLKIEKGSNNAYHGHYLNKTCTEAATPEEIGLGGKQNKYELGAGAKWKAKGAKGKEIKLVSAQHKQVACAKSAGSGMVLGPTRVQATFVFSACTNGEAHRCTTPGRKEGEIETKLLLGVVGESASKEALVSFTGKEAGSTEPTPAEPFADFECGGVAFTLHGTLSGRWTEAVNEMTKVGGIAFAPGTGEQGLIWQFVNPNNNEHEEEAVTLEATQSFKFKATYEMKQE